MLSWAEAEKGLWFMECNMFEINHKPLSLSLLTSIVSVRKKNLSHKTHTATVQYKQIVILMILVNSVRNPISDLIDKV